MTPPRIVRDIRQPHGSRPIDYQGAPQRPHNNNSPQQRPNYPQPQQSPPPYLQEVEARPAVPPQHQVPEGARFSDTANPYPPGYLQGPPAYQQPLSPYPPPYNQPQNFPQQGYPNQRYYPQPVSTGWKPWLGTMIGGGLGSVAGEAGGWAITFASVTSGGYSGSDFSGLFLLPQICCGLGIAVGAFVGHYIGRHSYENDLRRAGYPVDKEREDRRKKELEFWFPPKNKPESISQSREPLAQQPEGSAPKK